jgi:hypothetical protein
MKCLRRVQHSLNVIDLSEDGLEDGRRFIQDLSACMTSCQSIAAAAIPSAHPGQPLEEAFWRTTICNTAGDEGIINRDQMSASFNVYMDLLRRSPDTEEGITAEYYQERVALQSQYDAAMGKTSRGHVFCRTKNGYMGMVPTASLQGDIVFAFMGARTPFVIRRKPDGCYQLIGECYIHCMMNGEILELPIFEERLENIVLF